jgi:hypothetical protein
MPREKRKPVRGRPELGPRPPSCPPPQGMQSGSSKDGRAPDDTNDNLGVVHEFELPPWRQPLSDMRTLKSIFMQSHCRNECCWNDLCGDAIHFDVRAFTDNRSHHDGRNIRIQESLIEHHLDNFRSLLADIKAELKRAAATEEVTTLHFYCNHGKHRSVAACELLAAVVRSALDWVEIDIVHKGLTMHDNACHCDKCNHGKIVKSATLAQVFKRL